ncbi:uncharacterized protein LOC131928545 isoform X2 [Physella acuta]|uniref:uncharacterized protein LOC131928545 isoform X2 n=1 Tax=Physella acuta TaxID=109671 RepID=UPI0027DD4174|nr:uncharacterized protein LOC131928545 isoform X2 [Physella acuta]
MIYTSARLLATSARFLVVCMFLASTSTCASTPLTTPPTLDTETTQGVPGRPSTRIRTPVKKDLCHYDLSDPHFSLEASSQDYQDSGYLQCEYTITSPGSFYIRLNFTNIDSLVDMPVGGGVRSPEQQQADTNTTNSPGSTHSTSTSSSVEAEHNSTTTTKFKEQQPTQRVVEPSSKFTSSNPEQNNGGLATSRSVAGTVRPKQAKEQDIKVNKSVVELKSKLSSSGSDLLQTTASSVTTPSDSRENIFHHCSLKLIIEGVNSTSPSKPQIICWQKSWEKRIPLVYQYSVPIKITYIWDINSHSKFSLHFSFLHSEEVDCKFRCNKHLCLLKNQLCDGFIDCPDNSDEDKTSCILAVQELENSDSHLKVIIIAVIFSLVIIAGIVLMISRRRNGARQGRNSLLPTPQSQSTEVFRSSSMQDSSQYEALLHDRQASCVQHPQALTSATANPNCSENHHLLYQQVSEHHQQTLNPHRRVHQLHRHPCPENMAAETAAPMDRSNFTRMFRAHQQPLVSRQPQQLNNPAHSPSEHYPPQIPVSRDGEEGFASAQKSLNSIKLRSWQEEEVFRPPPNRTVHDRDSPPPPYSLNPPGAKSLDSLPSVGVSVLRQARASPESPPTGVPRCHSLSCHH